MCYKDNIISHYDTIICYYTLLFFLLFFFLFFLLWTHGTIIFSLMTHYFSLFFLLFSIMSGCQHSKNRNMQPTIPYPHTKDWLISVNDECLHNCIHWKVLIKKGQQPDEMFQDYYTHYFYYHAHYFSWLTSIAVTVSTSYTLQVYEHWFCVLLWA